MDKFKAFLSEAFGSIIPDDGIDTNVDVNVSTELLVKIGSIGLILIFAYFGIKKIFQ